MSVRMSIDRDLQQIRATGSYEVLSNSIPKLVPKLMRESTQKLQNLDSIFYKIVTIEDDHKRERRLAKFYSKQNALVEKINKLRSLFRRIMLTTRLMQYQQEKQVGQTTEQPLNENSDAKAGT